MKLGDAPIKYGTALAHARAFPPLENVTSSTYDKVSLLRDCNELFNFELQRAQKTLTGSVTINHDARIFIPVFDNARKNNTRAQLWRAVIDYLGESFESSLHDATLEFPHIAALKEHGVLGIEDASHLYLRVLENF